MNHKFCLLKKEDVPKNFKGFLKVYMNDNISKIEVHDSIINTNRIKSKGEIVEGSSLFLKGFKTFNVSGKALPRYNHKGEIESFGEGLNLDGITVIPNTSVNSFLENVKEAKNLKEATPNIKIEIDSLIALCNRALEENLFIIHYGL